MPTRAGGGQCLIAALVAKWREEATLLRRRGASAQADAAESYAAELEAAVREWQLAELTLDDAAQESGYSYSALQKKLANGELGNVGGKGTPRVRRGELPKKAGRIPEETLADKVLARRLG